MEQCAGWDALMEMVKQDIKAGMVKKDSPYNNLVTNLGAGNSTQSGLKLYTPTSFSDNNEKTGTVTLTATEA